MFNLNDRQGSPIIKRTMGKMVRLFSREQHEVRINPTSTTGRKMPTIRKRYKQLELLSRPLIIQSRRGRAAYPAPYFEGSNVDFISEFSKVAIEKSKNCMFYIIANNFVFSTGETQSHMLMGFFNANSKELFIVDPNGNNISLDNVYSGEEFVRLSIGAPLQNTLYNTIAKILRYYYNISFFQLRFYTGDALICPIGSPKNCTYRTIMIMLGFVSSPTLNLKDALETANFLSQHKFQEVKTLLLKIFNNDSNSKTYMKNLIDNSEKKNLRINYFSN